VKRLFLSGILAIGIHTFLLGTEFNWLEKPSHPKPKHRPITLSLTYRKPYIPKTKSILQKQKIKIKKIVTAPHKIKIKPIIQFKPTQPFLEHKQLDRLKTLPFYKPVLRPTSIVEPRKIEPIPAPLISKIPRGANKLIPLSTSHKIKTISTPLILKRPEIQNLLIPPIAEPVKKTLPKTQQTAGVIHRQARPLYRENSPPEYPRIARKRGYQGIVILDVQVTRNGKVGDLRVHVSSGYPVLDRSATTSVKDWQFEPGMKAGKPVNMWVRVPVRFKLE